MSSRLTLSLSGLADNYQTLKRHASSQVAGVVKADAYGLGAVDVVTELVKQGCVEFFVASATEGAELRHHFPEITLYVFEGAYPESIDQLIGAQLIPILNSTAQIECWSACALPAGIHIDTGMQRLGLACDDALPLNLPFPVELCVSHFARADEPGHASIAQQYDEISTYFEHLKIHHPRARLSVSNSAGMLAGVGPEDLGRAGIGLYGGNPFAHQFNPMQPVMKFEARILQIRQVPQGTPIGYGGSYVARTDMSLLTLGAGYADGIPRLLSNVGAAALGATRLPIVGRVSMDLLTVDASPLKGELPQVGEWVELIGRHIVLDEVAELAQTIGYEILTGLGPRADRQSIDEPI